MSKKKLFRLFLVILISFLAVTDAYPSEAAGKTETVETKDSSHYIDWTFITYGAPDFGSEKTGLYLPQKITVLETAGDGWGRIEINGEPHWVYLEKNLRKIDKYMPIYENKSDAEPVDIIGPQLIEIITQEDNWAQINTWLGPMWVDLWSVSTRVILDVPVYNQHALGYPTGCEIVSLGMMINYLTDIDINTLVYKTPRATNPSDGFRGNPAAESGFTVFPPALLDLTEEYLGSACDMSGCTMDDLKDKLSSGAPVVIWMNGMGFNVHAVCLTGYDENGFYYNDPWSGRKDRFITYGYFYSIWNNPIYDSVYDIEYPARKALSYDPLKIEIKRADK